jgi:RNA polymerase subunit RPABC4/transcription elongation factor Spt4
LNKDFQSSLAAAMSGQKRNEMNHTSEGKVDIREEIRLIPKVMFAVAALVFVGMQALLFLVLFRHDPHAPPLAAQVLVAFVAGSVLCVFMLLVGYVNRDAKRRGMNHILWTILVLFIPNAIGFIIYFVVRQPVRGACPQCGATVTPGFNFCPKCKFLLHPACPQCHRAIEVGATFCPYCSAELKRQVS